MPVDYSVKAPVLYGVGAIKLLGERAKGFGATKVMLVCDPNLSADIYEKAIDSVKAAGLDYVLFKGTKPDAPMEVIDECGELALKEKVDCLVFKAGDIAEEIGNPKTMNIVLLGALVKAMNVPDVDWHKAIKDNVKPQFVEDNIKAFDAGFAQ